MPKKAAPKTRAKKTKDDILTAAVRTLCREPAAGVTVEEVAREAGSAKGLVHYHFKTKDRLFAAAASRIWADRADNWHEALAATDPKQAIDASWQLLANESRTGVATASASLAVEQGEVTVQAVKEASAAFAKCLAASIEALFSRIGLTAAVPPGELGALLAAVVAGFGHQLDAGMPPTGLEAGYAAFWAGLLSLGTPA